MNALKFYYCNIFYDYIFDNYSDNAGTRFEDMYLPYIFEKGDLEEYCCQKLCLYLDNMGDEAFKEWSKLGIALDKKSRDKIERIRTKNGTQRKNKYGTLTFY